MLLAATFAIVLSQTPRDSFAAGFADPPDWARPHTWWHWMDGNVTKEGITADLEAMKEVGIGGAQMFTVSQGIPKGPVDYMGPLWREMTKHAVSEASRLGIELCIHNCSGWSSSGGPWVTPENAMQVIAWSTTKVHGPTNFSAALPQPKAPQVYANVPFYEDIAVYAFPTPTEGDAMARSKNFLGRTGVVRQDDLDATPPTGPSGLTVPSKKIFELTKDLGSGGKLTWAVPSGDWTIVRMGHVPTGKDNHPATPEGDGLEVDKLSRHALDEYWNKGTMATVIKDNGPLAGTVLNNSLVDSYEVGSQNWTPKMLEEFTERRGYDAAPWLPAIAGVTIDSPEKTERFLWDWRRTIADLYADNYYGYFAELCHKNGLKFSTEPYGNGGFDDIEAGGKADIPMGEFWVGGGTLETTKIASSTGHVYGRPVIGAESFTADDVRGRWLEEPFAAKALGDLVFCNGVNRYIFHRYAMQPWMDKFPGMTMGPWGTHLERTETWWTEAATWLKYVARCQFMLQQGQFVADALYYYGESAPVTLPYRPNLEPRMPNGYDYDGCDASVLGQIKVVDGKVVLPSGMTYRVLVLPNTTYMTPRMATTVRNLISAGATVVGPKPAQSPSLSDYPQCDSVVQGIADDVWADLDGTTKTERQYGQGRIVWGKPLDEVFDELSSPPDFDYSSPSFGSKLVYIHRTINGAEVYFVSNQQYKPAEVVCRFRVSGKVPELWHADTGLTETAPVYRAVGGRTAVTLQLDPAESVFVVFRDNESQRHLDTFGPERSAATASKVPQVVVQLARYESADGRGADVTKIVAQMVKEGQFEIPASNAAFGDPVVDVVKRLRVVYTLDGKPMTQTVAENETMSLAETPNVPAAPKSYDIAVEDGHTVLTAWKAGHYTGRTSNGRAVSVNVRKDADETTIEGPWSVAFKPGWGAPPQANFEKLVSWTDSADKGIKYFSGSATYTKSFVVPQGFIARDRTVLLDLGRVKNFATVTLNGKPLGVLWKEPFVLDVTSAVKSGKNALEVKVTNLWPNRIIGDEQLPPDVEWDGSHLKNWPDWLLKGEPRPNTGRYTFTTWHFWNKDSPLLESGLLGPVVVRSARKLIVTD